MKAVPAHSRTLLIVSIFIGFLSLSKGWLTVVMLPLLIVVIPVLYVTRNIVRDLLARDVPAAKWLVRLQLIGITLFYLCLPGVGDGDTYLVFGVVFTKSASPLESVSEVLCVGGVIAFLVSSVAIFAAFLTPKIPRLYRWLTGEMWPRINWGDKNCRD